MDAQKRANGAGIFFFVLVLVHLLMEFGLDLLSKYMDMSGFPTWALIVIPQAFIIVPVIVYFIITKQNVFDAIRLKKMHFASALLIIPVAYCLYPVLICLNAVSLAFSTNVIGSTMTGITESYPYLVALSLMAMLPAVAEETTFRGIILHGYHRDSNPWPAILAAGLCFGAMHMNLNQCCYAMALGIFGGIALEASGSILAPMILHFVYNGSSTTMVYLLPKLMKFSADAMQASGSMTADEANQMLDTSIASTNVSQGQMILVAGMVLPFAAAGMALAWLLLYAVAKLNHREYIYKGMFTKKTELQKEAMRADKVKIWKVFLIIGLVLCFIYAIIVEVIHRIP